MEQGTNENPFRTITKALQELNNSYEINKENTIEIAVKNVIADLASPIYINFILIIISQETASIIISSQASICSSQHIYFNNIIFIFRDFLIFDYFILLLENSNICFNVFFN